MTKNELQVAWEVLFDGAEQQAPLIERGLLSQFRSDAMAQLNTALIQVNQRLTEKKESQ